MDSLHIAAAYLLDADEFITSEKPGKLDLPDVTGVKIRLLFLGHLLAKLDEYGCLKHDAKSISLPRNGAYFVEDVCDFIIDAALKDE